MRRDQLLPLLDRLRNEAKFDAVFMISAEKGDGTQDLVRHLAAAVPAGPWAYPEDQAADIPLRLLAAEITRERIYDRLHQELPYATSVITEDWKATKDGARVEQTIFVERDGQKAIVLGKGGATIKELGSSARAEMERLFGHKVHLFLHVKVRENWADDPAHYREIGLEVPKR
jgi:GTP-binding protein Era